MAYDTRPIPTPRPKRKKKMAMPTPRPKIGGVREKAMRSPYVVGADGRLVLGKFAGN